MGVVNALVMANEENNNDVARSAVLCTLDGLCLDLVVEWLVGIEGIVDDIGLDRLRLCIGIE